MPDEPPQDRRSARSRARRATTGSAVTALAALAALGTGAPAQACSPGVPQPATAAHHAEAPGEVTVRPGDSVWSLATAHGVGVREFMAANELPAHAMLRPGRRLVLPTGHAAPQAPAEAAGSAPPTTGPGGPRTGTPAPVAHRHTVAPGETVWDLAERHGVSVAALNGANDLGATSLLRPGQTLRIPPTGVAGDAGPATGSARGTEAVPVPGPGVTPRDGGGAARPPSGPADEGRTYPPDAAADRQRARPAGRTLPEPARVRRMVGTTARAMGVDPALAMAHAAQESGFRQGVVSPANAVGTMQVVAPAGRWAGALVGRDLDLLDTRDNITAGVALIRELQEKTPTKRLAIAAYYQGLHGVRTYGMFSDTKDYVRAVLAQEQRFAE